MMRFVKLRGGVSFGEEQELWCSFDRQSGGEKRQPIYGNVAHGSPAKLNLWLGNLWKPLKKQE